MVGIVPYLGHRRTFDLSYFGLGGTSRDVSRTLTVSIIGVINIHLAYITTEYGVISAYTIGAQLI